MKDSTRRFAGRVEDYARYRPGYPVEVLKLLVEECGLTANYIIADVGSGTGILARMFLEHGCRVYGIEPNEEMRLAGEQLLAGHEGFASVAATAERTTLPNQSVDFITAGQAFHWFDTVAARIEFARILKPGGWVMLVWNTRSSKSTPFMAAYERLLKEHGTDYELITHGRLGDDEIKGFFGTDGYKSQIFENRQVFDLESLKGRLMSSSFLPVKGEPGHGEMMEELEGIFQKYEEDGMVSMEYKTRAYYGRLSRR